MTRLLITAMLGSILWEPTLGFLTGAYSLFSHSCLIYKEESKSRYQHPSAKSRICNASLLNSRSTCKKSSTVLKRPSTCLCDKKQNEEGDTEEKGKGGLFQSLNFFSGKDDVEKDSEPPEPRQKEGFFGFFGGRSGGEPDETEKRAKEKKQEDELRKGWGPLKIITGRFEGSEESKQKVEPLQDAPIVDTRATFVQFQRPPQRQVIPKTGTRAIPLDIQRASLPPRSTTPRPPPKPTQLKPPPPPPKVRFSKTRRILNKVKGKSEEQKPGEDGASMLGRFQSLFFNNSTNPNPKGEDNQKKKGESRTPLSAAQKFIYNSIFSPQPDPEQWIAVCPKTRLSPGEIVPVVAAGLDLIVVASKDAQNIYCMVNSCPHLGTPLETGSLERRPIEVDVTSASSGGFPAPNRPLQESDIATLLASDGCEDCIVCPLHRTAFALKSGQVRGEWCPYPPVLGKVMSMMKQSNSAGVFEVRTRGKNIEVRLNTPLKVPTDNDDDT